MKGKRARDSRIQEEEEKEEKRERERELLCF
jgi:hypothetical protein